MSPLHILSCFRWPFRWYYYCGSVNRGNSLHISFPIQPCNWEHSKSGNSIFRVYYLSTESVYRVAIIIPWGWFSLTCFTSLAFVLVHLPVGYNSFVYLQQLSEQCLLGHIQASGCNYSNNCLLKGQPVLVTKILPNHITVTASRCDRAGKCPALWLH